MSISKSYFITAKIFELIGVALFLYCWIIYGNTLLLLTCDWLSIEHPYFNIDMLLSDFIVFGILSPIIIMASILLMILTMMPILKIGSLIVISLFFLIVCANLLVVLIDGWIQWNKENLK